MYDWVLILGILFVALIIIPGLLIAIRADLESLDRLSNLDNYHEPGIWHKIEREIDQMKNNDPD